MFIVGFRSDLEAEWSFPEATHAYDALLHSQWVSGYYWERHEVAKKDRPEMDPRAASRVAALRHVPAEGLARPWRTVRDAISDLPEPKLGGSRRHHNHILQPGARSYPGHTGSPHRHARQNPQGGGHGVPGGENMLLTRTGEFATSPSVKAPACRRSPTDTSFTARGVRRCGSWATPSQFYWLRRLPGALPSTSPWPTSAPLTPLSAWAAFGR